VLAGRDANAEDSSLRKVSVDASHVDSLSTSWVFVETRYEECRGSAVGDIVDGTLLAILLTVFDRNRVRWIDR
jgi:hypothetical protein